MVPVTFPDIFIRMHVGFWIGTQLSRWLCSLHMARQAAKCLGIVHCDRSRICFKKHLKNHDFHQKSLSIKLPKVPRSPAQREVAPLAVGWCTCGRLQLCPPIHIPKRGGLRRADAHVAKNMKFHPKRDHLKVDGRNGHHFWRF